MDICDIHALSYLLHQDRPRTIPARPRRRTVINRRSCAPRDGEAVTAAVQRAGRHLSPPSRIDHGDLVVRLSDCNPGPRAVDAAFSACDNSPHGFKGTPSARQPGRPPPRSGRRPRDTRQPIRRSTRGQRLGPAGFRRHWRPQRRRFLRAGTLRRGGCLARSPRIRPLAVQAVARLVTAPARADRPSSSRQPSCHRDKDHRQGRSLRSRRTRWRYAPPRTVIFLGSPGADRVNGQDWTITTTARST
jgi:hypothetical protein